MEDMSYNVKENLMKASYCIKRVLKFQWLMGNSVHQVLLVVLFLTALCLPVMDQYFQFLPQMESTEQRKLAEKPTVDVKRLFRIPEAYEAYFNDNFGLRNLLVHWNSLFQFKWLKISPNPTLLIGKNGYLFYGSADTIRDYRGLRPWSAEELDFIKLRLASDTSILKNHGILYLVVVCPNKDTIYPEYMPDTITKVTNVRRLDQLMELQKMNPNLPIIDLRQTLRKWKASYPLYYKLDSHWNAIGGFLAYQEIMKKITEVLPEVQPLTMADVEITIDTFEEEDGDLVKLVAMSGILSELRATVYPKIKSMPSKKIRKALIFQDSFFAEVHPYLMHDFEKVVLIHHDWGYLKHDTIQREKPDVVIFEVIERNMDALLAKPSEGPEPSNLGNTPKPMP
jgi:alginate O-acetyltransferase complex protein AlgJ